MLTCLLVSVTRSLRLVRRRVCDESSTKATESKPTQFSTALTKAPPTTSFDELSVYASEALKSRAKETRTLASCMEAEDGSRVGTAEDVTDESNGITLGTTEGNGVGIGVGMEVGTILLSAFGVTVRPDDGNRGRLRIVGKADGMLVGCSKRIDGGVSGNLDGNAVGIGVGIGVVAAVGLHLMSSHIVDGIAVGMGVGIGVGIGVVAAVGLQLEVPHIVDGIVVGIGVGIGVVAVVGMRDGILGDGGYVCSGVGIFDNTETGDMEGGSQEVGPMIGVIVGIRDAD